MKTLLATVVWPFVSFVAVLLVTAGVAYAQDANMMNGGLWGGGWMGGYGGMWLPFLFVVALVGLVAWLVARKGK